MENPVLVEVTRGGRVESRHRGAVAVVDGDGATVLAIGDIARPVFPRSAVKAIQGLPLIESGAADRYGLTEAEIALAVSSHSGEPLHAETSLSMLRKAGRDAGCLECGAHWPSNELVSRALAKSGAEPSALNNNCSGKHAGFVCLSCNMDEDPTGYVKAAHPVQQAVREFGADLCVVFRNFPLTMHPQALPAAVVAEFAAKHGQFWPAHDALYANQKRLGAELYGELMQQLGLPVDQFQQDVEADAFEAKIRADIDSGNRSGVQGTPAFFINGESYTLRGGMGDLLNPIRALLGK